MTFFHDDIMPIPKLWLPKCFQASCHFLKCRSKPPAHDVSLITFCSDSTVFEYIRMIHVDYFQFLWSSAHSIYYMESLDRGHSDELEIPASTFLSTLTPIRTWKLKKIVYFYQYSHYKYGQFIDKYRYSCRLLSIPKQMSIFIRSSDVKMFLFGCVFSEIRKYRRNRFPAYLWMIMTSQNGMEKAK